MGFFSAILSLIGFGFGIPIGLFIGYFMFIYFQANDVEEPIMRSVGELDSKALRGLLQEIPLWVKNPDYERVDWLNSFVSEMWPYLDKAVCNIIRDIMKPIIDQYIGKYKIESIQFKALTLGSFPSSLQGIKVFDTQEDELIIELALRWVGNPNVTVEVKVFGIATTAQLVDLQVFVVPRVTMKPLVPTFLCFGKISITLMEKPHVDFGLKLAGGDLIAIPCLYRFV